MKNLTTRELYETVKDTEKEATKARTRLIKYILVMATSSLILAAVLFVFYTTLLGSNMGIILTGICLCMFYLVATIKGVELYNFNKQSKEFSLDWREKAETELNKRLYKHD